MTTSAWSRSTSCADLAARPDLEPCLVALNAGGQFRTGRYAAIPLLGDVLRTTSLLYRQTTALRTRNMVERFII